MQPPIAGKVVLGWDPAFRTGCKLAVVDETGKVLDTIVVFPTEPQNKVAETKRIVKAMIEKYNISLISVGNGTASRESELVIVDMLKELNRPVQYIITNEAGASVYSASKLATEEFPNFDVGQRSAASMARRLQDPLAELVKIDPKSIGVGQYQHDMNQKNLSEALQGVVETCVNKVGVDLNTASPSLLSYIAGVNMGIAKNIVKYREENGKFTDRKQLMQVPKLGEKAFNQCAGFLRITGGKNPLDATSVHPESYGAAQAMMEKLGVEVRLNTEVKEIASFGTDPVIIATGSTPRVLKKVPGHEKMLEACEYLLGAPVGEKIAVVGGGLTGCEIAYELALQGKDVTIVEMKDDLVSQKGVCLANSSYLREWFAWKQVPVYLETTLREVKDGSIVCAAKDGSSVEIPCDTVISSAGYISTPLVEEKGHKNVHLVGDCLRVGNLRSVVWRAYETAMKI